MVFTGDILCPLLRKKDIPLISKAEKLFIDTNDRFPAPESNHISFAGIPSLSDNSDRLKNWFSSKRIDDLLVPHSSQTGNLYFEEFVSDWKELSEIPHTTLDFLSLIAVPEVYLVHYWGWYDKMNYGEKYLDEYSLAEWAKETAYSSGLKGVEFYVPKVGEFIDL
jgi:hypothetical protein